MRETETPDRVWRVVWTNAHLRHKTDWTIHFEKVRELYEQYRRDWPGAEVEMQSAQIKAVGDIREMSFEPSDKDYVESPEEEDVEHYMSL